MLATKEHARGAMVVDCCVFDTLLFSFSHGVCFFSIAERIFATELVLLLLLRFVHFAWHYLALHLAESSLAICGSTLLLLFAFSYFLLQSTGCMSGGW
jgi:hypothetical protein